MNLGIKGKKAVITGAAGAIAMESAHLLAAEGVSLLLSDVDDDGLQQTAGAVEGQSQTCVADLSSAEGMNTLDDAVKAFGGCDILVHATGITGEKGDPLDMTDEAWQRAWDIDFMSSVRVARALVPGMVNSQWGRVVYITSENAVQPYADEAVYNAAKAALLNFTKCVSMPYAKKGVLFNAVSPAFIETDMTDGMMEKRAEERGESTEEAIKSFLREERPFLTMERRGKPREVAAVIAFLCSDLASFVAGSAYRVDGGAVGTMNI